MRVIPVLIDGARPLRQQQLPTELHKLAGLNALELSYGRYEYDANRLFDVIERLFGAPAGSVQQFSFTAEAGARVVPRPEISEAKPSRPLPPQPRSAGLSGAEIKLAYRERNVRTSYVQGTPNWVDLSTSDQAAAKAFYAGLFGWTYDDQPMGEGHVYSMAMLRGHQVAAISPQPPEMAATGAPPMWNTYLAVDSVDDATAKVEAAGGTVAMAPFDVMAAGRMSFVMDPSGAPVALWQAGQHIGATLVNEPGTINWNELVTTDLA